MSIFVATRDQVVRLERDGGSGTADPVLEDASVQCVAAAGALVLVGTRGHGAFKSVDAGATWEQVELPEPDIFSVAISAADGSTVRRHRAESPLRR
ncbi:MAG: hypothetical protein ACRDKF_17905 [Actinomycetota bacterium]